MLMLSYKISSSVCVLWGGGGGGTSSKYIVQMQPRWYTNFSLSLWINLNFELNPDDGGAWHSPKNMWDTGLVETQDDR